MCRRLLPTTALLSDGRVPEHPPMGRRLGSVLGEINQGRKGIRISARQVPRARMEEFGRRDGTTDAL